MSINNQRPLNSTTDSVDTELPAGLTGSTSIDSRVGLDVEHSSIAIRNIIDFYSSDAAQRLLATQSKIFSPGGTRATYYDLQGYLGFYFSFTDNSSGASGGTLYMRWSRDGTNTAYNDPGDGFGGTNFDIISTVPLVGALFIPKKTRYVNFVFVQGSADQGNTYPNIAQMDLTAYPMFFTNGVKVTNTNTEPVYVSTGVDGLGVATSWASVAGVDGGGTQVPIATASFTAGYALGAVGLATTYTGTPMVVANKLVTSATTTTTNSFTAATSTQIAATATARRSVKIYNGTRQIMYVKYGTAASTTSFSLIVFPGCTESIDDPRYSGVIHAYFVNTVASPELVNVEVI